MDSLWRADVICAGREGKDSAHYLVVGQDSHWAEHAAKVAADEAGVVGRYRGVYLTHVAALPPGTLTIGRSVLTRMATEHGVDLERYLPRLPLTYVTQLGHAQELIVEAEKAAGICQACGGGPRQSHSKCHLIP